MKANISKVTKECNNCCLCNSEAEKSNQKCITIDTQKTCFFDARRIRKIVAPATEEGG